MILTEKEQAILLETFFPLGQIPYYNKEEKTISFSETPTRRFILDTTAVSRSLRPSILSNTEKFDSGFLGFGIFESLAIVMQEDYNLYVKLFNFFKEVDAVAAKMVSSCSHAVVIFSHNSFGDRLFPHIHLDSGENLKTLSMFFNLTNKDQPQPTLTLLDELDPNSKFFKKGYIDHKLLMLHERKSIKRDQVRISNNMCILFDADKIPHTLSYTDDIWVTVVYDNVKPLCELEDKGRYHVGSVSL